MHLFALINHPASFTTSYLNDLRRVSFCCCRVALAVEHHHRVDPLFCLLQIGQPDPPTLEPLFAVWIEQLYDWLFLPSSEGKSTLWHFYVSFLFYPPPVNDELNGEPSPPGGFTGPGWKAKLFWFSRQNNNFKTKWDSFHPGPVETPSGWGLPIASSVIIWHSWV